MKNLFSTSSLVSSQVTTSIIRILVGNFMIYHGREVFQDEPIHKYTGWMEERHFPFPMFWAYLGKGTEFVGGVLLVFGLCTRLITIPLMMSMLFIIFVLGHGRIFYYDQLPFLFFLFFLYLIVTGPGKWSLDEKLNKKNIG